MATKKSKPKQDVTSKWGKELTPAQLSDLLKRVYERVNKEKEKK